MYPKPIERFFAPTTIEETLRLLEEHRGDVKLIAGGQSLMPMLKVRLLQTQCLIDLNRIKELAEIRESKDGLTLGAMARHADVEASEFIRANYPILNDAAHVIGDPQIRNRGTIGGSLVHADPAADYPAVVLALNAELTLMKSSGGKRTVPADKFFLSPMVTATAEDELLTAVNIPKSAPRSGGAYVKHSLVAGDFAIISVAAQLTLDGPDACQHARIVIGGAASGASPAPRASQLLAGKRLDDKLCSEAGEAASREVEVGSDVRASAEYRRELIKYLVPSMIRRAQQRAGGERK